MKQIAYLDEFNYFRGVSIFLVVLEHMLMIFGLVVNSAWFVNDDSLHIYRCIANVVWGGTALFVFISGFLFYYIFYQRGFKYKEFINKKIKNVFSPYIFMVFWLILLNVIYRYIISDHHWRSLEDFVVNTFFYWSFWYVPFIMLVFACSKLYLYFIEMNCRYKTMVLIISMLISLFIGRYNYSPLQSMLHFSVFYLLGIICAQYYTKILTISSYKWILFYVLYALIIYAYACNDQYISIDRTGFLSMDGPVDFLVLPKMGMCFLSIGIFNCFKGLKIPTLQKTIALLAKYSFSVFFLHNFIILITSKIIKEFGIVFQDIEILWICGFGYTVMTCAICVIIAAGIKKIAGRYSRYLIGA